MNSQTWATIAIGTVTVLLTVGAILVGIARFSTKLDEGIKGLRTHTDDAILALRTHSDDSFARLQTHVDDGLTRLTTHTDDLHSSLRTHTDDVGARLQGHIDNGLAGLRMHSDSKFSELKSCMDVKLAASESVLVERHGSLDKQLSDVKSRVTELVAASDGMVEIRERLSAVSAVLEEGRMSGR